MMIHFQHVTRRFGTKVAVDDLTLSIARGEIFAFLGPNGAGKTTSIKMLVGLLTPSSGTITVNDIDIVKDPRAAKASMGYVPDQPELYDKLTGREFLQFVADLRGMEPPSRARAIEAMIDLFRMREFVDDLSEGYSHGMKQRVAFAAAMVHDPAALVLDEPMVGLDPYSMRLVQDELRARANRGTTVLLSTHTLDVAERLADQIGVIHKGRMQFQGSVAALRDQLRLQGATLEEMFFAITGETDSMARSDSDDLA
jgi:ABC-2 type transport system ATP-binding protein